MKITHMRLTKLDEYWRVNDFPVQFSNEIYVSEKTAFYFKYQSVFSLKYVAHGEEVYLVGGKERRIPKGGYLLVNNEQEVTTLPSQMNEQAMSVFLEPGLLADVYRQWTSKAEHLADNPFEQGEVPRFFEQVYRQPDDRLGLFLGNLRRHMRLQQEKGMAELADIDLFYEITEQLLSSQVAVFQQIGQLQGRKASTREELYRRVSAGRDYLYEHTNRQVSLHEVSREAHLSPYHFHRLFQQAFSCSPLQYLKTIKLKKAQKMLLSGHFSITAVAFELGYPDVSSFSKDFKKRMGQSPSSLLAT